MSLDCWNQTRDVHGLNGNLRSVTTLHGCQESCIDNIGCVAIDWDPRNADNQTCWLHSSNFVMPTTRLGFINHYDLNRTCLGESSTSTALIFTPCLVLGWGFRSRRIEWPISGFAKSKMAARPPSWIQDGGSAAILENRNGDISAVDHPIYSVFGSRMGFSGWAHRMALFPVWQNSVGMSEKKQCSRSN